MWPFPSGPVRRGSVEPKTATTGTPSSVARCIVPVSFVRSKRHSRNSAIKFFECSLADAIHAIFAERFRDRLADGGVFGRAEENPLDRRLFGNAIAPFR